MSKLLPWLRLMRIPALFTSIADILLGYLLTHQELNLQTRPTFLIVLLASSLLYLSGMVWNDVFDYETDKENRPERPLPSGVISVRAAQKLGLLLMGGGMIAALFATHLSIILAFLLSGTILAYDAGGKKTPAGPFLMGGCRTLNVLLGASAGFNSIQTLVEIAPSLYWIAGGLGVYIAGVTWFAHTESKPESRGMLWSGLGLLVAGIVILGVTTYLYTVIETPIMPVIVLGIVAITVVLRAVRAIQHLDARRVQMAVNMMLFAYVMIDAILVYACTSSPEYAIATAGLLLPTMLLGRLFAVT